MNNTDILVGRKGSVLIDTTGSEVAISANSIVFREATIISSLKAIRGSNEFEVGDQMNLNGKTLLANELHTCGYDRFTKITITSGSINTYEG